MGGKEKEARLTEGFCRAPAASNLWAELSLILREQGSSGSPSLISC